MLHRVTRYPSRGQRPEGRHRGRIGAIADHGGHRPGVPVHRPRIEHAELVAFRVGQYLPRHVALADVGPDRTEAQQPFDLGRLMRGRGGSQVQVDPVRDGLRIGHRNEHQRQRRRIRVAVAAGADVDLAVVLLDHFPAQRRGPEPCQPGRIGRVDHQVHQTSRHPGNQAQPPAMAYCGGCLVSHCQNVRAFGPATKWPLPTLPVTSILSRTGTSGPQGARTLTCPLRIATSSASTTIPGLVLSRTWPLRTSMLSCSVGWVMTAWVKSSMTWPLVTFTSIRCGTTHRSTRRTCPLVQSMRATSLGLGAVAGTLVTDPDAGRSEISVASSPYVRAVSASSSRWSSSSALSRPSPADTRSTSTTRSLSSCEARSSLRAISLPGSESAMDKL